MTANFHPKNKVMWDSWFIKENDLLHVFYLQAVRAENKKQHSEVVSIGHAVSNDLINWKELPSALEPGSRGSWDDLALWTGSTIKHSDKFYMFYTGINSDIDNKNIQKIGLAVSDDLAHWRKYPKNPILEASSNYYDMNNSRNALGKIAAWRDPFVFRDPNKDKYYMTISARLKGNSKEYSGCIALAESDNLLHWKIQGPILAPNKYDEMETSQVIIHKGIYYLFFSVAQPDLYEPSWKNEAGEHTGLHCYWSNDLFGEYMPVNKNSVVFDNAEKLYNLRLIPDSGDRYNAIGWMNRDENHRLIGELSPPYRLQIKDDQIKII